MINIGCIGVTNSLGDAEVGPFAQIVTVISTCRRDSKSRNRGVNVALGLGFWLQSIASFFKIPRILHRFETHHFYHISALIELFLPGVGAACFT